MNFFTVAVCGFWVRGVRPSSESDMYFWRHYDGC